ncbi:MAG TPA: trigger factor [Afifellaceae bacterium]|nr:trigger factor [Afifellaceae bacterium]
MQISETHSEGLKRALKVTIPATELDARHSTRLDELKGQVRLKGFRPGKVPLTYLRKVYGKAAMAEIVERLVSETTRKALTDRQEKAASQPKVEMTEDEAEANRILAAEADLVFTMEYEVLPEFDVADYKGIKIERPVADVADEEVDERLRQIAEGSRPYNEADRPAQEGDRVTFSYVGKIDGEPFEGGADEDAQVVIGRGQFIPGMEEGLVGLKTGEDKAVELTFPEEYPAAHLAGKAATFDVHLKKVEEPGEIAIDAALAERLGIESLDRLRNLIREQIQNEYGSATRQKVKRQLLDALDEKHDFPLPGNLVEQEFDNIWRQVKHEAEHQGPSFEEQDTTEEAAREEYRRIAERRVRLGLVLSRIGEEAEVQVSDEEVQRALYDQMRRYPGQEQHVADYYRQNPDALQALRAPIFEEKVVDYILELADVTDKTVTKEELMAITDEDDELPHHHDHDHDHDHHHEH